MVQVKIYGLKVELTKIIDKLSNTIHSCIIEILGLPKEKRFHRFFLLKKEEFYYPSNRSNNYK